jgi:hypothetical protein
MELYKKEHQYYCGIDLHAKSKDPFLVRIPIQELTQP